MNVFPVRVGARWFALEAASCVEILGDVAWLPIAHRGTAVRGVFFWRRAAVPVVDLTEGWGLKPWTVVRRMAMMEINGRPCAVGCDEAREAISLPTLQPLSHPFGDSSVAGESDTWPLISTTGLSRRLEEDCPSQGSASSGLRKVTSALIFQAGPVDLAVPAALVEGITLERFAQDLVLDPVACLALPPPPADGHPPNVLICRVTSGRVALLAANALRFTEKEIGHALPLPRFQGTKTPLPDEVVLGWGKRPALLLGEAYLSATRDLKSKELIHA